MAVVLKDTSTSDEAKVNPNGTLAVAVKNGPLAETYLGQGMYDTQILSTLNATLTLETDGMSTACFHIFGTFVGTLSFTASNDDLNFFAVQVFNATTGAPSTTTAAVGAFYLPCAYKQVRVQMTAYTSGSATVSTATQAFASALPIVNVTSTLAAGTATIGTVRLPGASLTVSTTGAAGAAVTLTLPSGGAGNFHYISHLRLEAYAAAAVTAGATPYTITTTNLNGSSFYMASRALAQGDFTEKLVNPSETMRTQTAATAATFVMPATPNIIWAAFANYRVGP